MQRSSNAPVVGYNVVMSCWTRSHRVRSFVLAGALALSMGGVAANTAYAAKVAGIVMPDFRTVGGVNLVLNGIGVRTYSILRINIYVAGLYLTHPDHDARSILASRSMKVLRVHFVHSVSGAQVRRAWRKGLIRNCTQPCMLSTSLLHRFLDAVRPVRAGESFTFVFDHWGADVYEGGRLLGRIANPRFSRLMLAVFIGHDASQPTLKRELLGIGEKLSAR